MAPPHPTHPILKLAAFVALVALGAHAAHNGLGVAHPELDRLFDDWIYNGLMLGAALACVARALVVPRDRAAWLLLGAAALAWSSGDLYYTLFLAEVAAPPLPSVSDALFLSFYPAAFVGMALLVKRNVSEFHVTLWLDALIGALATSAVAAALLYDAVSVSIAGDTLGILTTLAYPLGDVLLLALVVGLFALTGWRPGITWAIIGAALVLSAGGDALYLYRSAAGTYFEGTILDSVWPASVLLLAIAGWRKPQFNDVRLEGFRIMAMPALFACAAIALLIFDEASPLNPLAVGLACGTIVALVLRMAVTLGENLRMVAASRGEALTDSLTGLGNRRKLVADLEQELRAARLDAPRILILFDLDGFKRYNDSFGHLAGDALLARLGAKLRRAVEPYGQAYRLGGDEFCAVVSVERDELEPVLATTAAALRDSGEGFAVESSYGAVAVPQEADSPALALQIADQRMYNRKEGRTSPVLEQTRDVLVRALQARQPEMLEQASGVAALAVGVGRRLGLQGEALDEVARAAELHDVGKVAVPDSILDKPEALTADEWAFMRRHTILGERILNGAEAFRPVARLVRSTHERYDGSGYPDGLAGEAIPLGARIVAVCDAYVAMTSDRPYRQRLSRDNAVEELRTSAGSQFDPAVVDAFVAELNGLGERRPTNAVEDDRMGYVREVAGRLRTVIDQESSAA
jgi:two-component system, cell cycle response regulator